MRGRRVRQGSRGAGAFKRCLFWSSSEIFLQETLAQRRYLMIRRSPRLAKLLRFKYGLQEYYCHLFSFSEAGMGFVRLRLE
jgi:hypothetical protein